jgi:hypothetical protein
VGSLRTRGRTVRISGRQRSTFSAVANSLCAIHAKRREDFVPKVRATRAWEWSNLRTFSTMFEYTTVEDDLVDLSRDHDRAIARSNGSKRDRSRQMDLFIKSSIGREV